MTLCSPLHPHSRQYLAIATGALILTATTAVAWDQVQIALIGEIERTCSVSGGLDAVDLGDVTRGSRRDLSLGVSCNTPFQYTLVSANGGLRHNGGLKRIGGFTDLLPYRVNVLVPTDTGSAAFSCASDQMTVQAGRCAPAQTRGGNRSRSDRGALLDLASPATAVARWPLRRRVDDQLQCQAVTRRVVPYALTVPDTSRVAIPAAAVRVDAAVSSPFI